MGKPTANFTRAQTIVHEMIKAGVPNPVPRIEAAIKRGADINAFDRSGRTPIQQSITRFSQLKLAAELIRLGADPTIRSRDSYANGIHDLLALKRSVAKGQAFLNAKQSEDMDAFIKLLADRGIDIDEIRADLDRWAKLARQRPGNSGWFRKSEIAKMERREAERKGNIEMP